MNLPSPSVRYAMWLLLAAAAAGAATWLVRAGRDPARSARRRPLEGVLYRGCAHSIRGLGCVPARDRELVFFVPAARPRDLAVYVDAQRVDAAVEALDSGARARVTVAAGARRVRLETPHGGFALPLTELAEAGALDTLYALRRQGELAALRAGAEALIERGPKIPAAIAMGILARTWRDQGDAARAVRALRRSAQAAAQAGVWSAALADSHARAFIARTELWRFDEARRALAQLSPWVDEVPWLRSEVAFEHALVARDTGDLRAALEHLREARRLAGLLGQTWMQLNAGQAYARILHDLGRDDEADAVFDELARALGPDPCDELLYVHNRAWVTLGQAEAGRARTPRALLERAVELSKPGGRCPDAGFHADARVNLMLADVRDGELDEAAKALQGLEGDPAADANVRAWMLELRGRIALREGDPQAALAAYDELRARVTSAAASRLRWQAELGLGKARAALGDLRGARESFEAAERVLDAEERQIPLGHGRGSFAGAREESARRLVDVLLRLGQPAPALRAARRARTRAIRTLVVLDRVAGLSPQARAAWSRGVARYRRLHAALRERAGRAWEVPRADLAAFNARLHAQRAELQRALDGALASLGLAEPTLAPPRPGELILMYFPAQRGWVGFAQDAAIHVHHFSEVPRRPEGWIAPFEARLRRATRLRVISYGALRELDVHAVHVGGRPLLERMPVVYALDLGLAGSEERASTGAPRALVVTDPTRDLPQARDEGALAVGALRRGGFDVRSLTGSAATRTRVRSALTSELDVFHFAGHGRLAGREGWLSALLLSGAQTLEVADILTLSRAPRHAVLLGCETAREAADSPLATVGVAQAFVLNGAVSVFATTRKIADATARAFAEALYLPVQDVGFDAPHFRRAVLEVAAAGHRDWTAFRMLSP